MRRLKRLLRTVNGEKVESVSGLLEFQNLVLPDKIKIGYMSFPVKSYVPPLLRCYRCQRYGHIAMACKGKQRCAKCGGEHRFEDCGDNVQGKCWNCGGQHNVAYGGCEVRKRAVEIQQVKTVNNISYAEAVKTRTKEKGRNRQDHSKVKIRRQAIRNT